MIAVFIPALMLEIFTTYFVIKIMLLNLSVELWAIFDFLIWNLFLVVPTIVAIFFGERTNQELRKLSKYLEKYSNYCCDNVTFQRVILFHNYLIGFHFLLQAH